jgi:DNA-binding XRE family transcriptional regulator
MIGITIEEEMALRPEKIRWLRFNILHLHKNDFSEAIGASLRTIVRWENGTARPKFTHAAILVAIQRGVDNYGEQRVRGVDWHGLLHKRGALHVLAGIFNFATTRP